MLAGLTDAQLAKISDSVEILPFLAGNEAEQSSVMLCYVMLYYVMSCYVMLCYVTLRYVTLCYVMLCYVMLCYVMLWYVMQCLYSVSDAMHLHWLFNININAKIEVIM